MSRTFTGAKSRWMHQAHLTPLNALVNSTGNKLPASLPTPVEVNSSNMALTVLKDKFISASALCSAVSAKVCSAVHINP